MPQWQFFQPLLSLLLTIEFLYKSTIFYLLNEAIVKELLGVGPAALG